MSPRSTRRDRSARARGRPITCGFDRVLRVSPHPRANELIHTDTETQRLHGGRHGRGHRYTQIEEDEEIASAESPPTISHSHSLQLLMFSLCLLCVSVSPWWDWPSNRRTRRRTRHHRAVAHTNAHRQRVVCPVLEAAGQDHFPHLEAIHEALDRLGQIPVRA